MNLSANIDAPPVRRRDPVRKRALILAAARELFAAQSYEGTSTVQIAERAKVSEGAVFNHFKSKRDLLYVLAEDYGRECGQAFAVESGDQASVDLSDASETSEAVVRAAFEFGERNRDLYKLFSSVGSTLGDDDQTPMSNAIISAIEQRLNRRVEQGMIAPTNVRLTAELIFAVVDRAYRAWCRTDDDSLKEIYIKEAARSARAISE